MPSHSVMLQLKNNYDTCSFLLDLEHTQLLYLNIFNKACHVIVYFVSEAALEFNY